MRIIVMTDDGQYVSEIQFNKDPHDFLEQMVRESLIEMRILDQGYENRPMPLELEDTCFEEDEYFEEDEQDVIQIEAVSSSSKALEIMLENIIKEGNI